MAADEHFIDDLFERLDEEEKVELLRMAGIRDDRPDILRGKGGSVSVQTEWMAPRRERILPFLFRIKNLANFEIRRLVKDGDFFTGPSMSQPLIVQFRLPTLWEGEEQEPHIERTGVQLTDLAAASAAMSELFIVLGGVNTAANGEVFASPPTVEVSRGSVEFAVGGGLFASGIGLIVACTAGLVAAPIVGILGGATLASVGIIELALDWKKKIAETEKVIAETNEIVHQKRRLNALEIKKKELELQMAHVAQQEAGEEPAYSNLIPRKLVLAETERYGITEEYANHLLNRALPTYLALRQYFDKIETK